MYLPGYVIVDLSSPQGKSVNRKEWCSLVYTSVDDIVDHLGVGVQCIDG